MTIVVKPASRAQVTAYRERVKPVAVKATRTVARVPVVATAATGRGVTRTGKRFVRWLRADQWAESAMTAGNYHMYADKIRAQQKENLKFALIGLAILAVSMVAFWFMTPGYVKTILILCVWSYLLIKGWNRGSLLKARNHTGLLGLTQEQINAAFLNAGITKKDHKIGVVQSPYADGRGVSLTVDLPPGIAAETAIAARTRLASSLALNANGLVLSGVTGDGGHAGRLSIWGTPGDPFAAGSGRHPLLGEQQWNAWRGAAFGVDARGRTVLLRLIGTHMLIGAAPNAGKSYAGRCAAAPFILDPGVLLYIADGKGSDTWAAAAPAAASYISGDQDEHALQVSRMLDRIIAEVRERNASKIRGTKLTETRSRDAADPLPLLLLIIDELQEYTGNASPDPDSEEKKAPTLGKTISTKLMKLGKLARSAGVILLLLTQRPDDDALPKGLRAVLLTRFALRTRDRWNSDMILGPDFASRGYSTASDNGNELRKGVGILVPDNGEDPDAPEGYPMLRTFELGDDDWQSLCLRGAALRRDQRRGEDPGDDGWGDDPVTVEPLPQPIVEAAQPAAAALPANVVALRDYLLRPGNEFRGSKELQEALGMTSSKFLQMMRELGVQSERDYVLTEKGKARCWGFWSGKVLRAIEKLDARVDDDLDVA